jgi:hypothetical protein
VEGVATAPALSSLPDAPPSKASTILLTAEPSPVEAGLYEALFIPRQTGGYHVTAAARDAPGVEIGTAQAGWASDAVAEEFRSLNPNPALLETLARSTGGELVAADRLGEFVAGLPDLDAPILETFSRPLWHQAGVFLFALACFTAEWGLRRWKGLA